MKILLSGEGPTDLGACTNAQGRCSGAELRIGPMAVLLSQRMAGRLGYDVIDYPDTLELITETALCEYAKTHATMGRHLSGEALADWLQDHPIDDTQAARMRTMPSFCAFTDALDAALSGTLGADWRTRHAPI